MPQGLLGIQYDEDSTENSATGLAGLVPFLELMSAMGFASSVERHLGLKSGPRCTWSDSDYIRALLLLNIVGGDCVDDIDVLNADRGLGRVLTKLDCDALHVLRQEKRRLLRRWEKTKKRFVPPPSTIRAYLELFHDEQWAAAREASSVKSFIPVPTRPLEGLRRVNRDLVDFVQRHSPSRVATVDLDATLVEVSKSTALYCYKGHRAYQPLNVWWAEQKMVLHTEFRDGNVPAGYENLRVLTEALDMLPEGVEKVLVRMDTAGYQHDILRYLARGKNERFGRIEFAIGCNVSPEFKAAVAAVPEDEWKPVRKQDRRTFAYENTNLECAEVCFVTNEAGYSSRWKPYRYVATRERMSDQQSLPGTTSTAEQQKLPFQTMSINRLQYKIHGIVSNIDEECISTSGLVEWLHERCGASEHAHSMMKSDFAGGRLPSKYFGANAAWWWMMMLSLNMTQALKQLALGDDYATTRMKRLRFALINIVGRVVVHARRFIIRIAKGHPSLRWILDIRRRLAALVQVPT